MKSKLFPPEVEKFIRAVVKGKTNLELTNLVNEKFGTNYTVQQIDTFKTNRHIKSGTYGYFPKGHIPQNKGKKMPPEVYEKAKATMFKKGHVPKNYKPVGSERINVDGYVEIKVEDHKPYVLKHRWVWEQANGKIPKGYFLIFLNQNKKDIRLENLALVTQKEHLRMNQKKFYFKDCERTKTAIATVKLNEKINLVSGKKWNIPENRVTQAGELRDNYNFSVEQIAEVMKIAKSTTKQYLKLYDKRREKENENV